MRAGDVCGLRSSVRPSASCLWMLHLPRSSRTFLHNLNVSVPVRNPAHALFVEDGILSAIMGSFKFKITPLKMNSSPFWRPKVTVSRFDLERRIELQSSTLENPDGSEIYFYHPFSVCSCVKAFTVGEFCVSLPDLMRLSTYAFFKRWSQRSDSHSLLCRRARVALVGTRSGAPGSAPLTRSCHLSPRSPSGQNVSLRNDAANWSHRKPPSSIRQAAVMSGRGSAD